MRWLGYRTRTPQKHLRPTTTWWCARRRPYVILMMAREHEPRYGLDCQKARVDLHHDYAPHPGHAYVAAQLGPVCGTRHSTAGICVQRLLDPTVGAYGPWLRHVGGGIRPPTTSPAAMADAVGVSPWVAYRATQKRLR